METGTVKTRGSLLSVFQRLPDQECMFSLLENATKYQSHIYLGGFFKDLRQPLCRAFSNLDTLALWKSAFSIVSASLRGSRKLPLPERFINNFINCTNEHTLYL